LSFRQVGTSFFEKKEAKKRLADWAGGCETSTVQFGQKFFGYFFSKKVTASSFEG